MLIFKNRSQGIYFNMFSKPVQLTTVNVDVFACIHLCVFEKNDNFAWNYVCVFYIWYSKSYFHAVYNIPTQTPCIVGLETRQTSACQRGYGRRKHSVAPAFHIVSQEAIT